MNWIFWFFRIDAFHCSSLASFQSCSFS